MFRLRDLPIRSKLIVLGIATSSCALLVISVVFLISTFLVVRNSVHADMVAQSAIVAENSTAALAFGDREAATETLQALSAKQSLDLACLYDRGGALFAEGRLRAGNCPGAAPADFDQLTISAVRIARPVTVGPRRVGTLYLIGNLDEVWVRLAIQSGAAMFGVVLAIIAAFLIARRLQALIAGPIVTLADTADAIARGGDYSLRAQK